MKPAKNISPVHGTILSVVQSSVVVQLLPSLSHGFPPYMASARINQETSLVPLVDPQGVLQGPLEILSILQSTESKVCKHIEVQKRKCSNLCNTCDQRFAYQVYWQLLSFQAHIWGYTDAFLQIGILRSWRNCRYQPTGKVSGILVGFPHLHWASFQVANINITTLKAAQ